MNVGTLTVAIPDTPPEPPLFRPGDRSTVVKAFKPFKNPVPMKIVNGIHANGQKAAERKESAAAPPPQPAVAAAISYYDPLKTFNIRDLKRLQAAWTAAKDESYKRAIEESAYLVKPPAPKQPQAIEPNALLILTARLTAWESYSNSVRDGLKQQQCDKDPAAFEKDLVLLNLKQGPLERIRNIVTKPEDPTTLYIARNTKKDMCGVMCVLNGCEVIGFSTAPNLDPNPIRKRLIHALIADRPGEPTESDKKEHDAAIQLGAKLVGGKNPLLRFLVPVTCNEDNDWYNKCGFVGEYPTYHLSEGAVEKCARESDLTLTTETIPLEPII